MSFLKKFWGLVVIFIYHTSSEFANLYTKSEKVLQKCDIFLSHPTQKTAVKISHFFEFSLIITSYHKRFQSNQALRFSVRF